MKYRIVRLSKLNLVRFYELLGLSVIQKLSFPESKFDLYFLGIDAPTGPSHGKFTFDRQGLIELTHNYGTEDDENFHVSTGNDEPHLGFSHVSISVDNVHAASQSLLNAGYKFHQEPSTPTCRLAIALDPNGYRIQLTAQDRAAQPAGITDFGTYRVVRLDEHPSSVRQLCS